MIFDTSLPVSLEQKFLLRHPEWLSVWPLTPARWEMFSLTRVLKMGLIYRHTTTYSIMCPSSFTDVPQGNQKVRRCWDHPLLDHMITSDGLSWLVSLLQFDSFRKVTAVVTKTGYSLDRITSYNHSHSDSHMRSTQSELLTSSIMSVDCGGKLKNLHGENHGAIKCLHIDRFLFHKCSCSMFFEVFFCLIKGEKLKEKKVRLLSHGISFLQTHYEKRNRETGRSGKMIFCYRK